MKKRLNPLKIALLIAAIGLCFLIKPCPHGGEPGHNCWVHPTADAARPMGSQLLIKTHTDSTTNQTYNDD
jgi:hypothetical protein